MIVAVELTMLAKVLMDVELIYISHYIQTKYSPAVLCEATFQRFQRIVYTPELYVIDINESLTRSDDDRGIIPCNCCCTKPQLNRASF